MTDYSQEFGEGVDRLYEVMKSEGLPQPEYKTQAFKLCLPGSGTCSYEDRTVCSCYCLSLPVICISKVKHIGDLHPFGYLLDAGLLSGMTSMISDMSH